MSWKIVGRWPLAARLTVWFAGAFMALFAAAVAALHLTLVWDVEQESIQRVSEAAARVHAQRALVRALSQNSEVDGDEFLRITDPVGTVFFETTGMGTAFPPDAFPPPGGRDRCRTPGPEFGLFTSRIDGWTYHFAVSSRDRDQRVALIYRRIGLFVGPIFVAALLTGYLLARAGLRPLRRVAATMQAIGPDRLDQRVPTDRLPAELAELAGTFNRALDRIGGAFARLDQFAADVAHEVRTPVHALRTAAEVVLRADRSPDDYRRTLAEVVGAADRLARLIDRLLLLARVSDPRAGLHLEPTDVAAELDAVREFFEPLAAEAGVMVTVDAPTGLVHRVDRALFQRAASNLVSNALGHTPSGGSIVLRARATGGRLTVDIADTGSGIPTDALPRLFDRYYRPPGADRGGGLGLGLAIVKRVAELHGGSAAVTSRPGAGTTVRLVFPTGAT